MMTFAHALHYDPAVALAATNRLGQTNHALTLWSTMLATRTKSGERKCFKSENAKKVCALGLMAVLRAPDDALTPEIRGSLNVIVDSLVSLLGDLRRKSRKERRTRRAASDDYRGKSRTTTSTMSQSTTRRTTETMIYSSTPPRSRHWRKRRRTPIRARGGIGGGFDDDDDDDDEGGFWFDDDDEEDYTSPLDDIDAFIAFSECMNALQGSRQRTRWVRHPSNSRRV